MRVKPLLLMMMGLAAATSANAEWYATIEDDIFSGGKKGLLLGEVGPNYSIAFDCEEGSLTSALIEKGSDDGKTTFEAELVFKVDQNPAIKMSALYGRRNPSYLQVISSDADLSLKVLKQLQAAREKILVGVAFPEIDSKWSSTASVAGSTRETTRFLEACKLN